MQLTSKSEFKLKKAKLPSTDEQDLILITAPDGNLFVNLCAYHNWCVMNQKEFKIEFITTGVTFITAELYAKLSGYTTKAIARKFENKVWETPLVFRAPDGELMVNLNYVEQWISQKHMKGLKR